MKTENRTTAAVLPERADASVGKQRAWDYEPSIKDAREALPGTRSEGNLKRLADANEHTVLINLSGTSRIDSWAIALFIQAMQHINAYGGKLAVFGIGDDVRRLLETVRLDQVLPIFPTREEALAGQSDSPAFAHSARSSLMEDAVSDVVNERKGRSPKRFPPSPI
jgi:anti-anti-sigma factor